jgi:hypothetical protein
MHPARCAMLMAVGVTVQASACGSSDKSMFSDPNFAGSGGAVSSAGNASSGRPGEEPSDGGSSPGSGGASSTAGAGMAGAPSDPPTPDPAVREGCLGWCEGAVQAACNDTTVEDCVFWCRAVADSPDCNSQYGELFDCAEGATFTCNDDGDAVPQGCELEYAQAGYSVLSNPDETIEMPCQAYCDAQEAAACTNSTSAAECTYRCQLAGTLVPACSGDWKTFIECAETSDVSCDEQGDPVPESCVAPYLQYVACVNEAGQ